MAQHKEYKLVESTKEALEYYYIPQHNALIPKCDNAQRVLITLLFKTHDVHSPTMILEYPSIYRKHLTLFKNVPILEVQMYFIKYVSASEAVQLEAEKKAREFAKMLDNLGIDLDVL